MMPDPITFIETTLIDPDTGRPFKLLPFEREFLKHAFKTGPDGRLLFPEQVVGAPKKTGKTGFAALLKLTTILLFGGKHAEGYCVANDYEQAQSRVFEAIKRIVEASPALRKEARITADKIVFTASGATITVLASDYASAAGGAPTISVFDELWAYTSERSRRLFDEMIFVPTRPISLRLTVTYAGFSGESDLLENLYKRGMAQPLVAPDLHAGDGLLMYWTHELQAPWQSPQWQAEMKRALRGNQYLRMIENRFVTSKTRFVDPNAWAACVDPNLSRCIADKNIRAFAGIDASVKHDSTALVLTTFDKATQRVKLLDYKIIVPDAEHEVDFRLIENTIDEWRARFALKAVLYDPFQMAAVAANLKRDGVPMVEFPQTVGNLTTMGENLYSLITGRNLWMYPSEQMREAIAHAVVEESARGWKISKLKQSAHIDIIIALGMAALATVQAPRGGMIVATVCTDGDARNFVQRVWHSDTGQWVSRNERPRTRIRWLNTDAATGEVLKDRTY